MLVRLRLQRTLENVSPIEAAQQVLSDLRAAEECGQKKVEEQIAEQLVIWMTLRPAIRP